MIWCNVKITRLTKSNVLLFKKRVEEFSSYLGIIDWELHVFTTDEYTDYETDDAFRAMTTASLEDKLALMVLNMEWDVTPSDYWLSRIAFHECLELLFWPITIGLKQSFNHNRETHTIIRTLENTFFELYWKTKKGKK